MSTPFTDETDQRPAFERLLDDRNFDEQGNFIKPDAPAEGESGRDAPPDPNAAKPASTAENTAANQPSPDAHAAPAPTATDAENKSGEGTAAAKPADESAAKAAPKDGTAPTDDEESEEALKAKFSKPTDKTGDEWKIRAYREANKITKKLEPVREQLDRVGPDRALRGLEFIAVIGEPDQPIGTAAEKLTEVAPTRAIELRNHYYFETLDQFPDNVASDLVGETSTVDELKRGLALLRSGVESPEKQPQSAAATTTDVPKPEDMSDEDWETFKIDYPQAYKAMQAQQAAAKPAPAKEAAPENPELTAVKAELDQLKERETTRQQEQYAAEVMAEGQAIENEVFEVVEERLRELGLDPDPAKDDATTVNLKKSTLDEIRKQVVAEFEGPNGPGGWDDWSLCTAEQKENRKIEAKMMQLIARKDKSARDYIDNMKARVQITLERVVEAQMKRHNAAMIQPTDKPRNAGQEHQRPEIIGGTAAAGTNGADKTPWLDPKNRLPGEDSFAAMKRMMAESQTLPGR